MRAALGVGAVTDVRTMLTLSNAVGESMLVTAGADVSRAVGRRVDEEELPVIPFA